MGKIPEKHFKKAKNQTFFLPNPVDMNHGLATNQVSAWSDVNCWSS